MCDHYRTQISGNLDILDMPNTRVHVSRRPPRLVQCGGDAPLAPRRVRGPPLGQAEPAWSCLGHTGCPAASAARGHGALRRASRCCGGTNTCASAAHSARLVVDDSYAMPGRPVGSSKRQVKLS